MKAFKKLAGMILAVCLMVPMFSILAFAADGVLMFSDPSTKVGENVNIDLVVRSDGGTVGDVSVTMNYDTSALEFVSGDGFSADGSGSLTYTGTGSSSELRSTMTFRALKQTDTTLTVNSSSAVLSSGETLNLEQGSSAISIAAADDGSTSVEASGTAAAGTSTDITVSVNGTDYNFSEAFTTADIPEGYSETTMTFNGEERKFVANESGITLGYLVDASGAGTFFLFQQDDATFVPFAQVTISDTTSLIPLDNVEAVKLPDNYEQSTLTVQGYEFPIWSDPSVSNRFYVIYALNTRTNEAGLYQYDAEDETYQYFEAPASTEDTDSGAALPGAFGQFISEHVMVVVTAMAVICLLLLILMIIFAVKLVHRNQELDDLYDEYDIPFDDEDDSNEKVSKKSSEKDLKSQKDEYAGNEFEDDEYEDDEYDDEYEDDKYDDDEYDDEYEDDEYDDEEYDDEGEDGKDKDYDINFIDL
ncbi:MAG TPA: hypothetical protein H9798_07680 [Candidatus Mediterraneibacter pullicola]|mgnify:CR=1 FL=1|uniref:Cohesin domain-containing protein n=1 Tax=Candidatus Mediterraneibacter pullicola TaxID=2838682 RepID=A0A9D2HAP1_9FIRM|nr:hypothetical protein [Candidatus Mediterraneibacter pullicola]